MAITFPKFQTVLDNKYLQIELKRFATESGNLDPHNFLTVKSDNKTLYTKYISPKSKTQVNLPGGIQNPLDTMAKAGKFSDMTAKLKEARKDVADAHDFNIKQQISKKPYLKLAAAIAQMGVETPAIGDKMEPLLKAYLAKVTPQAQYAAYTAMIAIVTKSKLDPVLRLLDEPPPAVPANAEVVEMLVDIKKDLAEGLRYFAAAEVNLDKKGVPTDQVLITRMFQSGRMRHEKVHTPYVKALKLDTEFKTRYEAVVEDKKKLDDAWAAYRARLGKK